ncbi:MAG TPA: NAD(P)/FAD-dependent oxidoreductase [Terriglobales bacterium]|nr:NAD(P)/FAD-dependent oxidoreductase [Terriglobales bacterium]
MRTSKNSVPKLLIIGAGFAGLKAAVEAAKYNLAITVVDRRNHHTFQPLLYQVATAGLSPGEIAAPIRGVLRKYSNVEVLLGEVQSFDLDRRKVGLRDGSELSYDYLIVASGATHSYFGHDDWQELAPGLKTVEDATEIRRRVLLAFELAERQAHISGHAEPVHFVVVGGGPTGVELAGTLAEVARKALSRNFRHIDPSTTRILLLEGGPRILPAYAPDLSESAKKQLEHLGVQVRTNAQVTSVEPGQVRVGDEVLPASVTLWAAGVRASSLGRKMGVELDRVGRVVVSPDLSVPGHPEVFVVGDLADVKDAKTGQMLPGLAPVAMQEGHHAARNIGLDLASKSREPFRYLDKGTMATIGRAAAIAQIGKLHVSGFIAWVMWLFVHIMFLVGFRNRVLVMLEWAWSYLTYQRSARLITGSTRLPGWNVQQHEHEDRELSVEQEHERSERSQVVRTA